MIDHKTTPHLPTDGSLYIAGRWQEASGASIEVIDPATEEPLATVDAAGPGDIQHALRAARTALPGWAAQPGVKRSAFVRAIADVLERHREALACTLVAEVGKPIGQARDEVDWAAGYARYMAEWDRRIEGEILPSDLPGESIHLMRVPLGVVVAICPWNFPIAVLVRKIAPALVTGNTVVVKSSEVTPLSALQLTRLIQEEAALPDGVLNVLTGAGDVGGMLVASPDVDLVTMTGHRDTGKRVMAAAAANLTPVSLELGGKAPAIVLADADLDAAVADVVTARHTNSGQVCTCAERVFVQAPIYEEFVERYVAAVERLTIGSPWEDPDMGPLAGFRQLTKAGGAVEAATRAGATVLTGGGRPEGAAFERGHWLAPTVLADVHPDMEVMTDEVFGPVTPVMPVASLEEALELSNESRYGLSAFLFTSDYRAAMRTAHELEVGEIYINRTHGEAFQAHHIGHGDSGIGGEDGQAGLLKYVQVRSVYHRWG